MKMPLDELQIPSGRAREGVEAEGRELFDPVPEGPSDEGVGARAEGASQALEGVRRSGAPVRYRGLTFLASIRLRGGAVR